MEAGQDKWFLNAIRNEEGQTVGTLLIDAVAQPNHQMPWRLYVTFKYQGRPLPSKDEFDVFDQVDTLIQELCKKMRAVNVAVWTHKGVRDWILYATDPGDLRKMLEGLFKKLEVQVETTLDPQWGQYRELLNMMKEAEGETKH